MNILKIPAGILQTNSYLVWEDEEAFVVDPGGYNSTILDNIRKHSLQLKYIILTHGHCDHIGGVQWLKDVTGAKVVSSKDEVEMLEDARINMSVDFGETIEITPDITVIDREILKVGDMDLEFIMTPGHSKGGMCIKVKEHLFSGDTLFNSSIGRTDFIGGSMETLIKSIKEKLFVLDDNTKVYPGHMGTTTIGYEKENNPFV